MVTEPAQTIPYDEMRRILGLPEPPFNAGGLWNTPAVTARGTFPQAVPRSGGKTPQYIQQLSHPLTEAEKLAITEGFRRLGLVIQDWQMRVLEHMVEVGKAARHIVETVESLTPEDQRPHPLHPAIPRPSHTPPIWANNPTRTHRRRNR
ncbi:hypothetical protein GTA09_20305 [Rhodococcus hoagii]|nr:hypothetical protein [Prescottella equi]NKZ71855.1 hypothetical protein [Prescottella equi]